MDFTDNDLRAIERDRDLPPDERGEGTEPNDYEREEDDDDDDGSGEDA